MIYAIHSRNPVVVVTCFSATISEGGAFVTRDEDGEIVTAHAPGEWSKVLRENDEDQEEPEKAIGFHSKNEDGVSNHGGGQGLPPGAVIPYIP